MTRVLIAGADSYLGTHIAAHLTQSGMDVETLDVRRPLPDAAFVGADAVVHVAGLAHQRESAENAPLYFQVNRDLTLTVAAQAKAQGVKQFIYFSSMSVYGLFVGRITGATLPAPNTSYGRSKWEAEEGLRAMESDGFSVAVLRPPMVYGKGCKGNYPRLAKLICKTPVFPKAGNERSMLYIDCLCAFVRRLVENGGGGLFFPQNQAYVSTDDLAREVAKAHGKRLWQPTGLGWLLRALSPSVPTIGKVFGTLTYDRDMSAAFGDEPQPDFARTIAQTEGSE